MNPNDALPESNTYAFNLSGGQGLYEFEWPSLSISARVEGAQVQRGGVDADVYVQSQRPNRPGHLRHARFNLSSQSGKESFIRGLKKRESELDWDEIVEQLCVAIIRDFQRGSAVVRLTGTSEVTNLAQWIVEPIIEADNVTVIYGPGGSGKSWIAQYIAVLVDAGMSHGGFTVVEQCPVLYLDWETSENDLESRISMIRQGLGFETEANVLYKKMNRSLENDIESIRAAVRDDNIGLVIVDSVGAASMGGQADDKVILPMFNAIRSIKGIHKLFIDHTNHQGGLYGSVYKMNEGRQVWEIKKDQKPGDSRLVFGMFHRKANNSKLLSDMGFEIDFGTQGQALFIHKDVRDSGLERHLSTPERIMNVFQQNDGVKWTVRNMAELLSTDDHPLSEGTIRVHLDRLCGSNTIVKHKGDKETVTGHQQYVMPRVQGIANDIANDVGDSEIIDDGDGRWRIL